MRRYFHGLMLWVVVVSPMSQAWATGENGSWSAMGRLFTTPDIRESLNLVRLGIAPVSDQVEQENPPSQPAEDAIIPKGPRYLTISGLVIKEDGAFSSVWLNDKRIETALGFAGENYRMEPTMDPSHGIKIVLIDHVKPFLLQPGQTLDGQEKIIRPSHEIPRQERLSALRGGEPEVVDETLTTKVKKAVVSLADKVANAKKEPVAVVEQTVDDPGKDQGKKVQGVQSLNTAKELSNAMR